jgi:DNA helicase HerA-like ATPase
MAEPMLIALHKTTECHMLPALANRHGLITGATGTGKTVTLQTLAESFSKIGVPVFMADVKGDLAGISQPGNIPPKLAAAVQERGLPMPEPIGCPTTLWDVFGKSGHPVRATITDMGPLLLGRMLNLNDTQAGVLNMVFKIADDQGLLLLDLKDLRAMLQHVGEHAREFTTEYGNVSAASVGAIQRALLEIEAQGGDVFFGAQNPLDVPETVLGQLGNRVQHALRAFTPRDQKAVKATAQTMRGKAGLDIEKAITELGVGEALVSLLDAKGRPSETEQVYVLLPGSQLGPITPEQRKALLANSLVAGVYEQTLDRESAYERLKGSAAPGTAAGNGASTAPANAPAATAGQAPAQPSVTDQVLSGLGEALFGSTGPRGGQHQGLAQVMVKSAVRNIGSAVGREIVRGVMGSILGGRKR